MSTCSTIYQDAQLQTFMKEGGLSPISCVKHNDSNKLHNNNVLLDKMPPPVGRAKYELHDIERPLKTTKIVLTPKQVKQFDTTTFATKEGYGINRSNRKGFLCESPEATHLVHDKNKTQIGSMATEGDLKTTVNWVAHLRY